MITIMFGSALHVDTKIAYLQIQFMIQKMIIEIQEPLGEILFLRNIISVCLTNSVLIKG